MRDGLYYNAWGQFLPSWLLFQLGHLSKAWYIWSMKYSMHTTVPYIFFLVIQLTKATFIWKYSKNSGIVNYYYQLIVTVLIWYFKMGFIFVMATMNLATIHFNLLIWCSRNIIIYGENSWATQKLWNLRYIFFQDSMMKRQLLEIFCKNYKFLWTIYCQIHFFNTKLLNGSVYRVKSTTKKGDFIRL